MPPYRMTDQEHGLIKARAPGFRPGRILRDVPFLRTGAIRLRTLFHSKGGAPGGVLFLFYHDMQASERAAFEAQIRHLRDIGDIVSPADAVKILMGGNARTTNERHICLTFDDGYRGAFEHAFPILASENVPAAFFVVAGWIDEARPGIIGWEDCRTLAAGGMEIGSHSISHRRLAQLDEAEAAREFVASRTRVEAETGRACVHFACPFGQPTEDYHPGREPRLARQAGYHTFFTTVPRRAVAGVSPWELPRVRMEPGWGSAELRYAFSRPPMGGKSN